MKTGIELIAKERKRHTSVEGWTLQHDLTHTKEELIFAAVAYALPEVLPRFFIENNVHRTDFFPFEQGSWKPTPNNRIKELAKAGALIAAEIDRLIIERETLTLFTIPKGDK